MVEKEQIEIDVKLIRRIIASASAKRGASGEWSLNISLDGDVPLDEWRSLPISRTVAIKARQAGRKPNPAQNWGKGGRGFKSKK